MFFFSIIYFYFLFAQFDNFLTSGILCSGILGAVSGTLWLKFECKGNLKTENSLEMLTKHNVWTNK